ncbi:sulfatase [Nocardioides marinquilinus]|uniref:Sulfatase n=1 Tax=Nocardioides marinquilinus TaxID=1210400 RepID=A0ABP9PTC3_9ACTN
MPSLPPHARPTLHRARHRTLAAGAVLSLAAAVPVVAADAGAAGPAPSSDLARSAPVPAPAAPAPAPGRAPRPNIVFVMADDLGWSDLRTGRVNGGNGSDFDDTPAIDRLAEQGMSFDNAYACLNCAPTRMALQTGLYATRPQNNVYIVDELDRGGDDTLLDGPPQGREDEEVVLDPASTTVAETLRDSGYRTGYVGKFHVARDGAEIVAEHGWQENFGGTHAGAASNYHAVDGEFVNSVGPELDRFAADYTQEYVDANIAPYSSGVSQAQLDALVGTDKHVSDALADATIDFIDRNDDEPFFTFLSTYAVHSPVGDAQARDDLLAKYQARTPGQGSPSRPSYAALVEGLDQSVARVVEHLETTPDPRNPGHPLADNTLVVFTSDNGGRVDLGAWNGPLRGQKGELREGGVRVPWVVWSGNPALVRGGTVNHSPINSTDLYPTLTSLARTRLPRGVPFDGVDLSRAFSGGKKVDRPRFAHLPGYLLEGGREQRPESTIRAGRHKLVYGYEDQSIEVYDVVADLGETTDLSETQPRLTADLGRRLVDWLDRTDAPLATLRAGRDPLVIEVPAGVTYADGRTTRHPRPTTLTIEPGQEVPLVLPLGR